MIRNTVWRAIARWAHIKEGERMPTWLIPVFILIFPEKLLDFLLVSKLGPWFKYDICSDCFTIHGIRYSGLFFRNLSPMGFRVGMTYRIEERTNGIITVKEIKTNLGVKEGDRDLADYFLASIYLDNYTVTADAFNKTLLLISTIREAKRSDDVQKLRKQIPDMAWMGLIDTNGNIDRFQLAERIAAILELEGK